MSEKVSIKIPAHLARYVKPDAPAEEKMKVISGGVVASLLERATLLFFLCYDKNQEIKSAALAEIKGLPLPAVAEIANSPEAHSRLKELLAKVHPAPVLPLVSSSDSSCSEPGKSAEEAAEEEVVEEKIVEEEVAAEEEEFRSKYQQAQSMGVGAKIKMALTGDKEWRTLLIRDSNKLVNSAVVKNPRITEPEILTISKSVIQNEEILRVICHNKEWVKNYEIRKALVLNNKTPLPVALRFMGFLTEKDLAAMGKSKNISSVIANQARRMLSNKKKT